jgi:hypothetical protein
VGRSLGQHAVRGDGCPAGRGPALEAERTAHRQGHQPRAGVTRQPGPGALGGYRVYGCDVSPPGAVVIAHVMIPMAWELFVLVWSG